MAFGLFQGTRMAVRALPFAAAMALAVSAASIQQAQAESDNPASLMWKKLKSATSSTNQDDGSPSSTNWSHAGSGGKAATTTEIVNGGSVSPFLSADSASLLQAAESRYGAIVASGGWDPVPGGKFKKGGKGKAIAALNRRLFVEGYLRPEATQGEFAQLYTSATEDAVTRFQRNHGLAVTGAVDNTTLKQLNVSAQKRLAAIRANLPRMAEYSRDLGPRYVVVNVPAMQIEAIDNGTVYSIHNAIVGRPSRPTPVVMTHLATVKFNPYWNAPPSIIERDILPRMKSSGASRVLRDMNIKVFEGVGGPEVDPDSVNWRRVVVDNYHFRQEPGGSNAMATAKIEFNSPFGIYLHDTPEPHLFNTGQRFYSSGCVRVEKVAILINWIMNGQDGIDNSRIAGLAETKERLDVTVANAPQLRVAYLTAWPGRNGEVHFRPDIYELDGSGFVTGQPLPVGETSGGQRFVLKPVPRSLAAVDAAEAGGFFNIFGGSRNPGKAHNTVAARRVSGISPGNVLKLRPKTKAKLAAKVKTRVLEKVTAVIDWSEIDNGDAKWPAFFKPAFKSKKLVRKSTASTAARKINPAKAKTAGQCKPAKDGKLPKRCKSPATAAAKPKVKPAAGTTTATN
jgi:murein L,D-transpeptidase YcbB/YkuD